MILLSHPTGNSNVRALAQGFLKSAILYEFDTAIALFPNSLFFDLVRSLNFLAEIRRRQYDPNLKPFTKLFPLYEMVRLLATKSGILGLTKHEKGLFSVDAVYRYLDNVVSNRLSEASKKGLKAVYAYEDGALNSFIKAKEIGLYCIYELPIAYWELSRILLSEEEVRLPEWASTLGGGTKDSSEKLKRKYQELELADLVVVPSQFVKDSLPIWALRKQLIIAPFGTPLTLNNDNIKERFYTPTDQPLRVLFVGSMGQRKGLGDLFAAVKMLNRTDLELVVLGSTLAPMNFYKRQLPNFTYEPGRSHDQVLALMRTCDVFCLPSIVEGRALVMQEAMSQGLPIIITPNTGGMDLVQNGKTGFVVPIRSPEVIAEKLAWFLANRTQIPKMGKLAQKHAKSYTWENYANTIIAAINYL